MKLYNLKTLAFVALSSLVVTSCLKDEAYENGEMGNRVDNNKKIIEIAGPTTGFVNIDLIGSNNDTTVNLVVVRLASAEPAQNDIQVTLVLSPTLVADYNADNGTSYVVPSAGLYTIPSLTVTIPRGSREGYVRLTTKPNNLIGTEYALGFRLAGVSDPSVLLSGNYNQQVVSLTIRNKYDGRYQLTGYHNRPTLDFPYNEEVHMVTTGANSTIFFWPRADAFGHPIGTGPGAVSWYGPAIQPVVVFDPSTEAVSSVFNNPPNTTPITRYDGATGSNVSRYNPATRRIIVHWNYNNNPARAFFDTLTYIGPR
jgi:hypothetical protein